MSKEMKRKLLGDFLGFLVIALVWLLSMLAWGENQSERFNVQCGICGSERLERLGELAGRHWYRCRHCGTDVSIQPPRSCQHAGTVVTNLDGDAFCGCCGEQLAETGGAE